MHISGRYYFSSFSFSSSFMPISSFSYSSFFSFFNVRASSGQKMLTSASIRHSHYQSTIRKLSTFYDNTTSSPTSTYYPKNGRVNTITDQQDTYITKKRVGVREKKHIKDKGEEERQRRRPRLVLNHSTFIEGLKPILEKIIDKIHNDSSLQQEELDLVTIVPGVISVTRNAREQNLKIKISVPLLNSGRNSLFSSSSSKQRSSEKKVYQEKDRVVNKRRRKEGDGGRRGEAEKEEEEEERGGDGGGEGGVGFKAIARKGKSVQEVFFVGRQLNQIALQRVLDSVVANK